MEFKRLRLFVALAEELHFGRAADRAGTTQSVLSVQIKRLEDETGIELFHRTTRAVRLTRAGEVFLKEARYLISRLEDAQASARAVAAGATGRLRVAATSIAGLSTAPQLLQSFRRAHPGVAVTVVDMSTVDQEAALAERKVDAGFLHPPLDTPDLVILPLGSEPLDLVLAKGDAEPPQTLDWGDLRDCPLIFYGRRRATRLHDRLVQTCLAEGFNPEIVIEAETFMSALSMALAGMGLAFIPRGLGRLAPAELAWVRPMRRNALTLDHGLAVRESEASIAPLSDLIACVPSDADVRRIGSVEWRRGRSAT